MHDIMHFASEILPPQARMPQVHRYIIHVMECKYPMWEVIDIISAGDWRMSNGNVSGSGVPRKPRERLSLKYCTITLS